MVLTLSNCHTKPCFSRNHQGFTLVEVLVALSIFAFLAVAAWQVFGQLEMARERTGAQADKLSELQNAYRQMQSDFLQVSNRSAITEAETEAAFLLTANQLKFTKIATPDPRTLKSPVFERITYALDGENLLRSTQKPLSDASVLPLSTTLLEGVSALKFTALDPGSSPLWPPLDNLTPIASDDSANDDTKNTLDDGLTKLPLGVSVTFDYAGRDITWRFMLPPNPPVIKQKMSENGDKDTDGANDEGTKNDDETNKSGNSNKTNTGANASNDTDDKNAGYDDRDL